MTVGDLRESLAKLDANLEIRVLLNGMLSLASEVVVPSQTDFAVLKGVNTVMPKKFTTSEQGLIGLFVNRGLGNDEIAAVLGRSLSELEKERKKQKF